MKPIHIAVTGLVCLSLLSSFSSFAFHSPEKKKVLRHVVSFQFKDGISTERQAQAIQDFLALKDVIPQIQKFEGGADLSVEGLDKGFTHCFILTFKNEADRDIYLPHPAHIKLAEKNKPLMKDLIVLDVWGEK